MGDWEREYARLASQQKVGPAVTVVIPLYPSPRVVLECRACEEQLVLNTDRRWVCECEASELSEAEVRAALESAARVLRDRTEGPVEDSWLEKVKKLW